MSRSKYYKKRKKSDLRVITKAKELVDVSYNYTENFPNIDRFTLRDKIRNTAIEVVELLVETNEIHIDHKLIRDLNRSIQSVKEKKKLLTGKTKVDINEMIFIEQKLLILKLTAAIEFNSRIKARRDLQNKTFAKLSMMDYYIEISYKKKLINEHKKEVWADVLEDVSNLLGAWVKSDEKRVNC